MSADLHELVQSMIEPDVERRFGIDQILKSKWVRTMAAMHNLEVEEYRLEAMSKQLLAVKENAKRNQKLERLRTEDEYEQSIEQSMSGFNDTIGKTEEDELAHSKYLTTILDEDEIDQEDVNSVYQSHLDPWNIDLANEEPIRLDRTKDHYGRHLQQSPKHNMTMLN